MEEKELSGEESFKLINRMIYEAKGYFYESGLGPIVYGFSALICSILSYIRDDKIISLPFSPFYFFIPVFFIQAFIQFKEEKRKKAKTFTDEAIDYVWIGFFLSVIATFCGSLVDAGYIIITIILILIGMASFITGSLSKFRYMIFAGILCLIIAAVSFFIQNKNIYFMLAAAAALVWIIPGFMMRAYFKKQNHAE